MQKIYLGRGFWALVDDQDFDLCSMYGWYIETNGYARAYMGRNQKPSHRYLHQVIADRMGFGMVDHEDRNRLNCQRYNLRESTYSQNGANSRNKGSIYGKGIDYHQNTYRVRIKVNYKQINLGCFLSLEEAQAAYKKAAQHYFGEFANAGSND